MINSILIALIIVAIVVSLAALIVGCFALCFVIGLKNSTHQVVFKEMNPPAEVPLDPFSIEEKEVEHETVNPNKRIKPFEKFENAELVKTEEEFADLDDPGVSSNFP